MARSSSSRADDHDRLRLLATPSPRTSGAEKKESTDLRLSQACQRCATPSSISYFDRHLSDAHTAEDEAVKSRSNKSAKVVLGRVLINWGTPFDVRYAPDSGAKADIAGLTRWA